MLQAIQKLIFMDSSVEKHDKQTNRAINRAMSLKIHV